MSADDLSLPDDMDVLKSMIREMAAKASVLQGENEALKVSNAAAEDRIRELTDILKAFDRARFGRRSEKLGGMSEDDEAQQAFVFEEIETGIAALQAQVGKGRPAGEKRAPRPRKDFAPHLERIEVVIEPEDLPEHAGKQKVLIGEVEEDQETVRGTVSPTTVAAAGCRASEVPRHCHPPPEICLQEC